MNKKVLLVLVIVFSLVGCNKDTGNIPLSTLADYEEDQVRNVEESLTEKERLDREYRQTKYLEGYDELHDELIMEIRQYVEENLVPLIDVPYTYTIELNVSNYGYSLIELGKTTLSELMKNNKDEVNGFVKINYFVEDIQNLIEENEYYYIMLTDQVIGSNKRDLFWETYSKMSFKVSGIDSSVLNQYKGEFGYVESYETHQYELQSYTEPQNTEYSYSYISDLEELKTKYGIEFLPIKGWYFAPKEDINIIFEKKGHDDNFLNSLHQHAYSHLLEKLLDEYDARDKIGYFLDGEIGPKAVESFDKLPDDNLLLGKSLNGMTITLYYLKEFETEENNVLLKQFVNAIFENLDANQQDEVVVKVYEMSKSDIPIALKLLDEAKLSQNYIEGLSEMSDWQENRVKVRNDSDAFKFIDCFGVEEEYIFRFFKELVEKRNFEFYRRKTLFD